MHRIEFVPRLHFPLWLELVSPVFAIALSLIIGALLLLIVGINPFLAYKAIFSSAFFGGWYALSDTAVKASPLILTGLACALAFRARIWNIGAEGQLYLGAWAATGIASFWLPNTTPRWLTLLLMIVAASLAGAIWAFFPALLKARYNINEIVTSLMLVYVAQQWNNYWIYSPWSDRGFQLTPMFPKSAWLPRLTDYSSVVPSFSGLTMHMGLLIGIVLALIFWWVLKRTTWGFQLRILGDCLPAARYAGVSVQKQIVLVMVISGALAGLAGMGEVAGVVHRLQERFSPGYGFTAIIIAFLAKLHPLGVVLVSFLFGGLLVGAKEVQPAGIPLMLQGVILFVVIGWEMAIRYRIRVITAEAPENQET